jgi:serine/threonine protein kinase
MLPQGYVYGDYKILSGPYEGGYGIVFKALRITTGKEVALKFTKHPRNPHWYGRFKNENTFLHQLKPHENIIQPHSHVTHDKVNAYYSMEYLEAGLENYLGNLASSDTARRIELFNQICNGLDHAHSKKIYHRDLHASNIRMDADRAKLVDFGLGKDGANSTNSSVGQVVWFGGAVTTPEAFFHISDKPTHDEDVRKDVYALGIILYTLFASSNVAYALSMRNSMEKYFIDNNLLNSYQDYLELPEKERKAHYAAWLSSLDSTINNNLNVFLTDIDLANNISSIIKKACSADYNIRYASVQDILTAVERL